MIRRKTCLVSFILLAIVFSFSLFQVVEATAMDFTVHGDEEVTKRALIVCVIAAVVFSLWESLINC
jgi:TRAP-type uncharacterized transport system fused permease subunit